MKKVVSDSSMVGALLAATALSAIPASAQTDTAPKGTLVIGWQFDPGTLDPQMHRKRFTQIISHAMRDKLAFQTPPGLKVDLLLAESVTQIDPTNYLVKIRQGVKFHNGLEMTADDVIYTFTRLWDPALKSPRATMGNMPNIEKLTKIDDYTIQWTTKVPFGEPETAIEGFHFSGQEILQKSTFEKLTPDEARTAAPIGVGAFKFVEWLPDQRVVMEAFDDYWQGAPKVKNLIWRTIPEETVRVAELLAGSVDIIYPVATDSVQQLRDAGMTLEIIPSTVGAQIWMNVREGSPFHDVEVRKAINQAIDKSLITEHLFSGLALPNGQVAGIGQAGYIEGYDPFPYNPDAAKAVLSKVTEPIELLVEQQMQLTAEVVAEQLRGYGMNVTTTVLDLAGFNSATEAGNFNLALGAAAYGSGEFAGAFYNGQFECSRFANNRIRTGHCSPELDELHAELRKLPKDDPRRAELLEKIIRDLTEVYVPWAPLYIDAEVWAMQPHVKGFVGSSVGQFFNLHQVSVEK